MPYGPEQNQTNRHRANLSTQILIAKMIKDGANAVDGRFRASDSLGCFHSNINRVISMALLNVHTWL